jgi:hypothetical protein
LLCSGRREETREPNIRPRVRCLSVDPSHAFVDEEVYRRHCPCFMPPV